MVRMLRKLKKGPELAAGPIQLQEKVAKDKQFADMLKPYSEFFARVLHISALRVHALCQRL